MDLRVVAVLLAGVLVGGALRAQQTQPAAEPGVNTRFVPLANNANAILLESANPDPQRGRIAILIAHPEHINTFTYFIGHELAKRGYRAMMVNYYGPEHDYDEFLTPLAKAVQYLRSVPGVQKIVIAGHSTGGAELTYYQDVAENGPKACQGAERVYPCRTKAAENLPPVDGVMIIDSSAGALERLIALDPSMDNGHPRAHKAELDMFNPKNGYNPDTKGGTYTVKFERRYFEAQGVRQNRLIDDALARLAKIEKGEGDYKDDEPFVVVGSSVHAYDGARIDLADTKLVSKTHAPHLLLKADGSTPVQIVASTRPPLASSTEIDRLERTTQDVTVRHFLTFLAMRTTPGYKMTVDGLTGVEWRSVASSVPGNVQGIKVPSLFMSATCAPHLVFTEVAYDLSVAKDKEFVGVEGADHQLRPCKPQFGDTSKRAFDYVDRWLLKPGRF